MHTDVGYNLYLPPGYGAAASTQRYPVIYWLHGRGCSESTDQFPPRYVEQAIRAQIIPPLLVVYASGGGMSFYSDSADGQWLAETTLIKELIPHIDATWRTIPDRGGRAVQGMSMGGFGAMKLALKYPELFSSVVAFAGGYRTADEMLEDPVNQRIMRRVFAGDPRRFDANRPSTLARAQANTLRGRLGIKLLVGLDDPLLADNNALHNTLDELFLLHQYDEVPRVRHDLPRLAAWLGSDGLEFAVEHFAAASAPDHDGPWVNPPSLREQAPGVEHHLFWSNLMRRPVGYNIYLPPDYYGEGAGRGLSTNTLRYPVVYFLPGLGDTESTHLASLARLDEAVRAGRLPPFICVWAYAGRHSFDTDYADGSVRPESVLIRELIPQIDARWRTRAERAHRALQGWGMGGAGALRLACLHPELFGSVASLSGAFEDRSWMQARYPEQFVEQYGTAARFATNTVSALVRTRAKALASMAIYQMVGDRDPRLEANRRLDALLTSLHVTHQYTEFPALGHDPDALWNTAGIDLWGFHARAFAHPASVAASPP